MTESEEIRIQRMGLVQLPTEKTDEIIDDEDFELREELFQSLKESTLTDRKAFTGTKPAFEIAENQSDKEYVPCYLPVPIMKIEGTILNKITKSGDRTKPVPAMFAWAMEEAAEWCKEYTTFDEIKGKNITVSFVENKK